MYLKSKGLKAAIIYIIFGITWVLLGDIAARSEAVAPYSELFQTTKGIAFVLCSGILCGILIYFNDKKNQNILAELEANSNEMRLLMDNTLEAFILIDKELRIISFNKQFADRYKLLLNKTVKKGDHILAYAQDDRKELLQSLYARVLSGESVQSEIVIPLSNGQTSTFRNHYKPAKDAEGKIIGAFIASMDISEKKIAEQQLAVNEKRFRALVENVGDMISLTNKQGEIIYLSPAFEKVTGYTLAEMKGMPATELMHLDQIQQSKEIFEQLLQNPGVPIRRINQFVTKEGHYVWVEGVTINLLEDESIQAIVANYRDISERKAAEEKLLEAEERFRTLIENNYDGIILRDSAFKIQYCSVSSERILGWTCEESQGKNTLENTHPDDYDMVVQHYKELLDKPGESIDITFRTKHKNGHYVWVQSVVTNMLHVNVIGALVANFRDVTEKKLLEQQREFDHKNLYALINNTDDLIWSMDRDHKRISSNKAFDNMVKKITGRETSNDAVFVANGFKSEQINRWSKYYDRAFKGESFIVVEETLEPIELYTETSFHPIRKDGDIIGIACFSRNITERKLFERNLRENTLELIRIKKELEHNEARLKQAQAIAHVGNWEINFETGVSKWSDEAFRIFGREPRPEGLSTQECLEIVHPDDVEFVKHKINVTLENSKDSAFYHRVVHKDGSIRQLYAYNKCELNDQGKVRGVYGVVYDVTEEKEAQEKIKKSQQFLQKLTNKVPIVVYKFQMDKDGKMSFPFVSKAIDKLMPSLNPLDLKSDASKAFKLIHSDDQELVFKSIAHSYGMISDWNLEFRVISPDNSIIWLLGSAVPEAKEDGVVIWHGYLQNITEQKNADEQLRISKERYDLVAKATNDSIYDWDLINNRVKRSGDGLRVLFGYDNEQADASENFWSERIHPDDFDVCMSELNRILADPSLTTCHQEYRFLKADGRYAYIYDKGFIIRNEKGEAIRMIGATQDISSRKKIEEELKTLNDELELRAEELVATNEELEQFAYIASHDLQEPLRMVTSFLNLLQIKYDNELDDKARQYIYYASDGAVRMRRIILDLLEYSRVGRKGENYETVSANDLLLEALELNKAQIEEKEARILYQKLPLLVANRSALLQVFQNLISNALKYQRPGTIPGINISFVEDEKQIIFSIQDNGIGIETQYFEKIFVVFQRLHNKNDYSGTGIGLAICKKIIEHHKGRIWLESMPGKGSTFFFSIPKSLGQSSELQSDAEKIVQPAQKYLRQL